MKLPYGILDTVFKMLYNYDIKKNDHPHFSLEIPTKENKGIEYLKLDWNNLIDFPDSWFIKLSLISFREPKMPLLVNRRCYPYRTSFCLVLSKEGWDYISSSMAKNAFHRLQESRETYVTWDEIVNFANKILKNRKKRANAALKRRLQKLERLNKEILDYQLLLK